MKALRDNPKFNDTINRASLTREQFERLKKKGKKRTAQEDISFIKNSFFGQARSYQNPSEGVDRQMAIKTDYSKHHEALNDVTITNEDFAKVINRHKNNPDAFFYLDPPYFGAEMEKYYPDYNWEHKDYYQDEVERYGKIGHRHDQSISGLLINRMNNRLVKNVGKYNFLDYCRIGYEYSFIESNPPASEFVYKTKFIDGSWQYIKTQRDQIKH
jgi:site-specific DNA-adenine methylase